MSTPSPPPRLRLSVGIDPTSKEAQYEALERCLHGCQAGDLRARIRLARFFRPLIRSLAERRAGRDTAEINRLCALGREGLYEAARRYTPKVGVHRFRLFALDYIERAMEGKPRPFWRRLFRR
jgi:DNA-directed RNA polymerase specialized sigma subunit